MRFRVQSAEFRVKNTILLNGFLSRILFTVHCLLFTCFFLITCHLSLVTAAQWHGVDESVIDKYAKEHGREAMTPLINTDQGDHLLFVFLLAGAVGGFAAGYYWRMLTEGKRKT